MPITINNTDVFSKTKVIILNSVLHFNVFNFYTVFIKIEYLTITLPLLFFFNFFQNVQQNSEAGGEAR